ncbi:MULTISPECIES: bile acid:sodium symporter family protein [unclassified Moraxella]|uniref:bile acid:sodium symporter family protein n=1 Tax=unclassified Moraxella TaxID=2685852 RepID=UPI003AF5D80E
MNAFNLIPFALAYIMFVLGLQLTLKDFLALKRHPKAVLTGLFCQMLIVPTLAFLLVSMFSPPPSIAFGIMLLSFCAGGATSNLLSFYAKGDVALAVTLTAVTSLACVVTMPLLIGVSFEHFMGTSAGVFNSQSMSLKVFVLTTLPVLIGMTVRHYFAKKIDKWQKPMQKFVNVLFVLLVVGAVASNWQLMLKHFVTIGALVLLLAGLLLLCGMSVARLMGLPPKVQKTIAIETSLQNGAMGIALAPFIMHSVGQGLPEIAVPSAVYGVLMNLIVLPYVWWCMRDYTVRKSQFRVLK